ncbi:ABC transporter ATP-binding protein [Lichenibacterium ramalinae]|uniref:ABC transporter ATP-binding protein n=1 Tax=Lichenibacterium ramalinae TaxID=2316527 RepID=A0A4Q2RF86_9HYPH|nr:ABC transporter ATP-binding protein [Lichenibacterium ramalinae]RYB06696.1 ABC transporter ATP-binding protein [Lichenibacterium ramalinae]
MSAFALRDIAKAHGAQAVLKGVTIEAAEGEFIALVGPSGCGKSTLLRIAAGLDRPDAGTVSMSGRDVTAVPAAGRDVAMVFQSYALYPHLTAGQNIAVPLAMRELSGAQRMPLLGPLVPGGRARRADIARRVAATAASLRIDGLLDRKPGQMSGGQRQRVALARAMVRQPGAFLMDEPLSNLDANLRVHARGEIVELHRRAGVPTLYVTHDQAEALSMADRVAVMIGGTLLQIGTPQAIYDDPAHVEVARFVGNPRINLLPGRLAADGAAVLAPAAPQEAGPGSVTLGIRPEALGLRACGPEVAAAAVSRLEFLGSEVLVFVRLAGSGEEAVAKMSPAAAAGLRPGCPVALAPAPGAALAFAADGARLPAPAPARIAAGAGR